jgi:hypothetical protein
MVDNPPESILLFSLCENMRWNHLPRAGGLYDQHPRLLEQWRILFREKAVEEKRRNDEDKRKQRSKSK